MKRVLSYVGVLLAAIAIIGQPIATNAAETSSGLSITPRKNLNIQPGGSVSDKLTVTNLDPKKELRLSVKMIDFSFTDESGTPKLMIADDAPTTEWSLKPFTTLPKNVTIPPGKTKNIEYSIKIPKGQGAGSYYSAFQYASGSSEGGEVSLSATGVTLVFVSVPGVVKQDLTLKKFGAYQTNKKEADGGSYVFLATKKPDTFGFTLENKGNVAESPVGSITYKHMFGEEKTVENINPLSFLALRGQTRLFTTCIKAEEKKVEFNGDITVTKKCQTPDLLPGRYSLTLNAFYGQNGNKTQEITATASFWYLPWWFLGLVAAAIVLIVYFGIKLKRKVQGAVNGVSYQKKRKVRRR